MMCIWLPIIYKSYIISPKKMNFPFTEVDFGGDDPSAPIIQPSNGASQPRAPSKTKKNALDTSQVTNSKVSFPDQFLTELYQKYFLVKN